MPELGNSKGRRLEKRRKGEEGEGEACRRGIRINKKKKKNIASQNREEKGSGSRENNKKKGTKEIPNDSGGPLAM